MEQDLQIINDSQFPTPYLQKLSEFIMSLTPLTHHRIFFKNAARWKGRNFGNHSVIKMHRYYRRKDLNPAWPLPFSDSRIKLGKPFLFNNRTELLVFLIGHELSHSFQTIRGFAEREFIANDFGESCVKKWRECKQKIWMRIIPALRLMQKKVIKSKQKKVKQPVSKIEIQQEALNKYRMNLKHWQRKMKLATNKCKSYSNKVRRLEKLETKLKLLQNGTSDILSNTDNMSKNP